METSGFTLEDMQDSKLPATQPTKVSGKCLTSEPESVFSDPSAKMGNKQAATVQVINVRKLKTRTYNMTSKVGIRFRY